MPETASWFVTFGRGTPRGGHYTEVRVPASLALQDQEDAVRRAAFANYGTDWAFDYPETAYAKAIGQHKLALLDIITVEE